MDAGLVIRLLGPLDELTVGRILALDPTLDEIEIARAWLVEAGEEPELPPSSARVDQILAIVRPAWEAWEGAFEEEAAVGHA